MTVDAPTREEPKKVLQETTQVHDQWITHFRGRENDPFYDLAFDYIASVFGPPGESPVVDAGCGSGVKTLHLARRGYRVRGLDLSAAMLEQARDAARAVGLESKVTFETADLTALTLPANSVGAMICWGVLMHVPPVEKAIAELSRVLAPGGVLVISEGNKRSLQSTSLNFLKRALGRERAEVQHTPAGIEFWEQTSSGRFMTRQADIPWMIAEFARHGVQLERRRAGQFTEGFMLLPWKVARLAVHACNNLWFRMGGPGGPSYGNLLVLRKRAAA